MEEVLLEKSKLPPALQLYLHKAHHQAVGGYDSQVDLVRPPLAPTEADLVLDVARYDVEERGHLRFELR
eukprot:CAMPEP_0179118852 /NCGR_PEP_ID=MMETSP0796-20121207/55922_1 /TAXON_ID=73915 /ORGANISM="Pyrodinium bahamense, Strain pbaha01" /LENGTH=68 /DNA_ID=CAMNT_0020817333 /DNA_START=562 /DNA_END=764 /DNA_ORIENTATION=+